MDLSRFRISHGDEEPSGENLEYDPAFISLELAAQPGEERQVGDTIIPAEEPDHREVITQAADVLGRSHDLRAVVFLAHALLRTEGFPGFAEATGLMRWMLEEHWATCHPQLDADDDDDPTMRVNAVVSLADTDTVLRAIRLAPLTDSRTFGRFSLRDMLIAEGEVAVPEGMDNPPEQGAISAAFQDTNVEKLQAIRAAVTAAQDNVKAIGAVFDDKIPTRGPDLDALERLLKQVVQRFTSAGVAAADDGGEDDAAAGDDAGDAPAGGGGGGARSGGAPAPSVPGAINSANDVRMALDRIIAYYQRAEPSSPVPLLLTRAKRLVGADFMAIIKDMARQGQDQVNMIGGIESNEDY